MTEAFTESDADSRYGWAMRILTLFAGAALSGALVFSAACSNTSAGDTATRGQRNESSTAAEVVKASVQKTTEAKTAQLSLTATLDGFVGSQQVTGNGAADFDAQRAQAHIELMGIQLDGVVDGANVYAKSSLFGDASWYRLSDPKSTTPSADGFAGIWAKLVDPTQMFQLLTDASGSMTQVGSEKVGGVDTTHFSGNISVPTEQGTAGAQSSSVPVDVWVDGQGRIARIQSTLSSGGGNVPISGKVTVDFHDYGKAVSIEAPPSGQIKDLPEALGLFGGGARPQQSP